jgi:hypothetical protein
LFPAEKPSASPTIPRRLLLSVTFADKRSLYSSECDDLKKAPIDIMEWLETGLDEPPVDISLAYYMLENGIANLARYDDLGVVLPEIDQLRSACRQLWMTLRRLMGSAVDQCLDKHVPVQVFDQAMACVQGPMKMFQSDTKSGPNFGSDYRPGWDKDDIVHIVFEDVVELFQREEEARLARRRADASAAKRTRSKSPVTTPAPACAPEEFEPYQEVCSHDLEEAAQTQAEREQSERDSEAGPVHQRTLQGRPTRRRTAEAHTKRVASKSPAPLPTTSAARSERTQSRSPTKSTASPRKPSSASSAIANASTSPTKSTASPRKPSVVSASAKAKAATSKQNDRGEIISPTNPVTIPVLNAPNRFFETLPAPEVWHRRMAPYFTFGETPAMQKLASDQIQDDLQRSEQTL